MNKELEILLIKKRLQELKLEEIEIEKRIIKQRLEELDLEEYNLNKQTKIINKSETDIIEVIKEISFEDNSKDLNLSDIKLKQSKSFNIYA